jgi:membrane-associated phospholipid phosphatase
MSPFFYKLFENISALYKRKNLLWQLFFCAFTYILVMSGFDWFYYLHTRNPTLQSFLFPAAILGFFVPIILPIIMLFYYLITKNHRTLNSFYAVVQAALLGLGISSFYKVFTGRVAPPLNNLKNIFIDKPISSHLIANVDTSHVFHFGFLREGAFWGWPSSHTATACAVSAALFTLYPENKFVKFLAVVFALYIGLGVSATIHWFSDFVAGAILGIIIGLVVGKSFLARYTLKHGTA